VGDFPTHLAFWKNIKGLNFSIMEWEQYPIFVMLINIIWKREVLWYTMDINK
jgi:hypothetical protein